MLIKQTALLIRDRRMGLSATIPVLRERVRSTIRACDAAQPLYTARRMGSENRGCVAEPTLQGLLCRDGSSMATL